MLNRSRERLHQARGFTLIELAMVIVVVSILGVVVLTRYHDPAGTTVSIEADHLARDIRHMQTLAMTWGQTLRLTAAGTGYSVSCVSGSATPPCNGALPVIDPATAAAFNRPLESNVTVSNTTIEIDALGRPVAGGALFNGDTTYTLTGGSEMSTVTVTRLTGFVSVVY